MESAMDMLRNAVASRAEAWIETTKDAHEVSSQRVASRAEAWIETRHHNRDLRYGGVASRAEAWIETRQAWVAVKAKTGRLPCGGVD